MRKERTRAAGSHVCLTVTFPKSAVEALDDAGRMLELSREEVLLRGFDLLSLSACIILGHDDHNAGRVSVASGHR